MHIVIFDEIEVEEPQHRISRSFVANDPTRPVWPQDEHLRVTKFVELDSRLVGRSVPNETDPAVVAAQTTPAFAPPEAVIAFSATELRLVDAWRTVRSP